MLTTFYLIAMIFFLISYPLNVTKNCLSVVPASSEIKIFFCAMPPWGSLLRDSKAKILGVIRHGNLRELISVLVSVDQVEKPY